MARVLILIPNPLTAGLVARGLHFAGLPPTLAFSASQANMCLKQERFSLLVVNLAAPLPELGADLAGHHLPVLALGQGEVELIAPFEIEHRLPSTCTVDEIVGHAVAIVALQRPVRLQSRIGWGELRLDVQRRTATWKQESLALTTIQFRILEVLVLAAGSLVTVSEIARRVWGEASFDDGERILAHIRRIRRKLERNTSKPEFLLTVRGEGFRLAEIPHEADLEALSINS